MKIRVTIDKESGPLHGSRLEYSYAVPEPEYDVLRRAVAGPPFGSSVHDEFEWRTTEQRARLFREQIALMISGAIVEALAEKVN